MNESTNSRNDDGFHEAIELELIRLKELVNRYAPHDGFFSYDIPSLYVGRTSNIDRTDMKTFYLPSFGFAAQGAKTIMFDNEAYQYDKRNMFITPIALPISMRTTLASSEEPFIGIRLDLDPARISELTLRVFPNGLPPITKRDTFYAAKIDHSIINAVVRLFECLERKSDIELIAPIIIDEILIRLLRSDIGLNIAEMGFADSELQKVSKAISWLRENFTHPVKVAELAELVHMSSTSFHEHFKSVTKMTPLQYQKTLRLHEARRLMLSQDIDAVTACRLTGYVSDSQFNRDYSNYFGSPPKRNIIQIRQQMHEPI